MQGTQKIISRRSIAVLEAIEVRRLLSTLVVNTLADETVANSTTSLREAIAAANAGDVVQFKAGLGGTVTLGGGELVINKDLTISGPGAGVLGVSGNDASRVMQIGTGVSVSIAGLTITKGRAEDGAGIYSAGALTLTNCVISNNVAVGFEANDPPVPGDPLQAGAGRGGGIYNAGVLAISGTTLAGNHARGGGGIGWYDSPANGGNGLGGAIYSATAGAGVALTGSVLSGNTATGGAGTSYRGAGGEAHGGAVYALGVLAIIGTTFSTNSVTAGGGSDSTAGPGGAASGGAVYAAGAVTASGGRFYGNTVTGGPGGSLIISTSDIGGSASGGAIFGRSTIALIDVTLDQNGAMGGAGGAWESRMGGGSGIDAGGDAAGGAIAGFASAALTRCTLTNNAAKGGPSGGDARGGAADGGSLTVTDSTFAGNQAVAAFADGNRDLDDPPYFLALVGDAFGGAIRASGALAVSGSTLSQNKATGGGGADAEAMFNNANSGGDALGGAIYAAGGGAIVRSTIFGNLVQGGDGGDGKLGDDQAGGSVELRAGDGGDAEGGGIYKLAVGGGALTVTASTVAGNTAVGGAAGTPMVGGTASAEGSEAGGGVAGAGVALANALIATNAAAVGPDVSGTVTSSGFNLIGKSNGSSGWIASDNKGSIASPLDPGLGPLAGNGGPTKTMALLAGSPALDAGKAFGLTRDQRGTTRPRNLSSVPNAAGGDGSDIGAFELQALAAPIQTPFKSFVIGATPLTIEAEDFDNGGEGVAYHDLDAANAGGAYRATGVDLQPTNDGGDGYNVGWAKAGEWLEYTANVQAGGYYGVDFRVASKGAGGTFHLEFDGTDVTGPLMIPNTGGWQNWTTLSKDGAYLGAGTHVLRLVMDTNGPTGWVGNFNHLKVRRGVVNVTTGTAAHVRDGSYRFSNFGSVAALEVKKSTTGYNREAYLLFDTTNVATISLAKLRLYGSLTDTVSPSIQLGVFAASATSWSESAITWANKPSTGAAAVGTASISGTTKKWYEVDLSSLLKAEKAAGRNLVTLVLGSNTFTSTLCAFASDEAANAPQVVIQP